MLLSRAPSRVLRNHNTSLRSWEFLNSRNPTWRLSSVKQTNVRNAVTATVKETPDPRTWKAGEAAAPAPPKSKLHQFFNNRLDRLLKEQRQEQQQKMRESDAKRSALVDRVNKKANELKSSSLPEEEKSNQIKQLWEFLQKVSPVDAAIFRADFEIDTKIHLTEAQQLVRKILEDPAKTEFDQVNAIEDVVNEAQLKMVARIYWYNKENFGDKLDPEWFKSFDKMKEEYPQWFEKPIPMSSI